MRRFLTHALLCCCLPTAALAQADNGKLLEATDMEATPEVNTSEATGSTEVYLERSAVWQSVQYSLVEGRQVVEGDIVIHDEMRNRHGLVIRGFARASSGARWPNGVVPYVIDGSISKAETRDRIANAIAHWEARTPLRFVQRTADNAASYSDYLSFVTSSGCASHVGRIGGQQRVWLADVCSTGNAIHEIGHAIGLYHEHTRPDRNNHVQINWANIQSGKSHNFEQRLSGGEQLVPYDHGSVMHYGSHYFSTNGKPTIEVIGAGGTSIGQRSGLSSSDIAAVNRLYGTDLSVTLNASPTSANPGDTLVLHAQATNQGSIEAAEVTLRLPIPQGSSLVDVAGVDWLCIDTGEVLCSLETLASTATSQVVVQLTAPDIAGELNLYAALDSEAHDFNTSNNVDSDAVQINGALHLPRVAAGQQFTIADNSPEGTSVGRVEASHPSGADVGGFRIVSGDDGGLFEIDASSGWISVRDGAALASSSSDAHALGIVASTNGIESSVTLVQINVSRSYATGAGSSNDGGGGSGAPISLAALLGTLLLRRRH